MSNTCLIIIDVQNGIFKMKRPVFNESILIKKLIKTINSTRNIKTQIIYSQHENNTFLKNGTDGWKIIEDIKPIDEDILIYKNKPSIFDGTNLNDILKKQNISKLIITGLISNGCIKDTCLAAKKLNYEVTLLADGHSTFYKNAEKVIKNINNDLMKEDVEIISCEEYLNAII